MKNERSVLMQPLFLTAVFCILFAVCPAKAMHMEINGETRVRSWFLNDYLQDGSHTEFIDQRLRLTMNWGINELVSLTARADVLEGFWGNTLGAFGESTTIDPVTGALDDTTEFFEVTSKDEITFDLLYGTVMSPSKKFIAAIGRQVAGWGHGVASWDDYSDRLKLKYRRHPLYFEIIYIKLVESFAANLENGDAGDNSGYAFDVVHATPTSKTGLLLYYQDTNAPPGPKTEVYLASAYIDKTFGALQLKTEVVVLEGDLHLPASDPGLSGLCIYAGVGYNSGPHSLSAEAAWARGDDPDTLKIESAMSFDYDSDFHSLVLFNNADYDGYGQLTVKADDEGVSNAIAFKITAGTRPAERLDLAASVIYAERDEAPPDRDRDLGWEFDLTGSYTVNDHVTYAFGFGYLAVGDYFGDANNPWLLMNGIEIKF